MFGEDEPPKRKPQLTPMPLDALGVEELETYIGTLRAEIARAEAQITRKKAHLDDAARLFKT